MPALLNASEKYKLKMAFHLEPYPNQTALSVKNDIEYIIKNYGHYPALYKTHSKKQPSKQLPLFYIYDSYKISNEDWAKIATVNGSSTIRNTAYDSILIGLALKVNDIITIATSGFDGVYTYFAGLLRSLFIVHTKFS
jgi:glycoprotein endo-alpha-1,2-mannosidase